MEDHLLKDCEGEWTPAGLDCMIMMIKVREKYGWDVKAEKTEEKNLEF